LSTQKGEICLQKYLPISGNCLKQTLWLSNHLTTENNLKVEKRCFFRKEAQLFPRK